MPTLNTSNRYFKWHRFAWLVLGQAVILGAIEAFCYTREGTLTTASVGVIALFVWINFSFAVTWRDLMKRELSGELSVEQYRADPVTYLRGSKTHQRITFWGGIAVAILFIAVSNLF
jgi:hypothetical protein